MHPASCFVIADTLEQCNVCGYYAMLDEYEAAAAGFRFSVANECVPQEQIHANAIEVLRFGLIKC
jgi:hypothetical protein